MKNTDTAPMTSEEILEDLMLFHDPEKIKDTLDLLLECYVSSHVIDTHRRSKREDVYNHINKMKEILEYGKMWQESR